MSIHIEDKETGDLDTTISKYKDVGWIPIEKHPRDDKECVLAEFHNGVLYVADRGWYEIYIEGKHEEWEEVEDGIQIKLWEEQEEEGEFVTNHCLEFEPTHYLPLEGARLK